MKYGLQFPRGCSSYILHSIRLSCSIGKYAHPPLPPPLSLASPFTGGERAAPSFYHVILGVLGAPLGCWSSRLRVKIADFGLTFGF